MKVKNALVCLNCDEIHTQDECPKCLSIYYIKLRDYFKPLISGFDAIIEAKAKREKSNDNQAGIGDIQKKAANKIPLHIDTVVYDDVNKRLEKRKRMAISFVNEAGDESCQPVQA
jgi:hypothetical protein